MSLADGPVYKRLLGLWLPMIGGVLAVKAIGLSDAYFVGQLGQEALAAISFTFPIVMILVTLAIGLGAGASSVLSRVVGAKGKRLEQREIVTGAIVMAMLVALTISALGYASIATIFDVMGASEDLSAQATAYMRIWFAGSVFLIVPVAVNGLLRATGDGMSPAILMSVTAALNISLNPLFIFGLGPVPGFGMQGAAMATVLARSVSMLVALGLIWKRDLLVFSMSVLKGGLKRWHEIGRVALPAALSTSFNPIALSLITASVASLGSAEVAAFGVVSKIQGIAVVPLLALSSAASPLVGQNSAAGEPERSRHGLYWCVALSLIWAVLIAVVLYFSAPWLVTQFSDSEDVQQVAREYLMIVPLSYAGYGIIVALSAGLNGLGHSFTALLVSGTRAIVLLAAFAWIGVQWAGFSGMAVGIAVANTLAGLGGLYLIRRHRLQTRDSSNGGSSDLAETE